MNDKYLSAWTPVEYEGSYPPYISINYRNSLVQINVRDIFQKETMISIPLKDFRKLIFETQNNSNDL